MILQNKTLPYAEVPKTKLGLLGHEGVARLADGYVCSSYESGLSGDGQVRSVELHKNYALLPDTVRKNTDILASAPNAQSILICFIALKARGNSNRF